MFARVATYQGPPELIDEGIRIGKKQILPQARQLDGFKGVYFLVERQSGKHLTITLWESEEAIRASEQAANRLCSEDAEAAGAMVQIVERFEVVFSPEQQS
jgi:heme-degrading monooxygenase HmoA